MTIGRASPTALHLCRIYLNNSSVHALARDAAAPVAGLEPGKDYHNTDLQPDLQRCFETLGERLYESDMAYAPSTKEIDERIEQLRRLNLLGLEQPTRARTKSHMSIGPTGNPGQVFDGDSLMGPPPSVPTNTSFSVVPPATGDDGATFDEARQSLLETSFATSHHTKTDKTDADHMPPPTRVPSKRHLSPSGKPRSRGSTGSKGGISSLNRIRPPSSKARTASIRKTVGEEEDPDYVP